MHVCVSGVCACVDQAHMDLCLGGPMWLFISALYECVYM